MGIVAGFQTVDITPPVGARLGGYAWREHGSEGIAHPLRAKAMVLSNGETKVCLVTCDLLSIDPGLTAHVRQKAAALCGIPPDHVMIVASHTHSGPLACRRLGPGGLPQKLLDSEEAYFRNLCEVISGAVVAAARNLRPVRLGVRTGPLPGIGSNRMDPSRPIDDRVHILALKSDEAGPASGGRWGSGLYGLAVNFACHPTVLDHRNYLISGDYPSFTQDFLERLYPGCTAMFLQGAAGDISTRHTRRASDLEEARRVGEMLAGAAATLLYQVSFADDETLAGARCTVSLPPREFPAEEEVSQLVEKAREEVKRAQESGAPANILRSAQVILQGAERIMRLRELLGGREISTEVQVLRLGPLLVVGVPGELFNELGAQVGRSRGCLTVVAGYANDYVGYLVPREAYEQLSYESAVTVVGRGGAEAITEVAEKLIAQVI